MANLREQLIANRDKVKASQQERFKQLSEQSGLSAADFIKKVEGLKTENPEGFNSLTKLVAGQSTAQPQQTQGQPAPIDTVTGKPQGVEGTALPLDRPEVTAEKIRLDQAQTSKPVGRQRPEWVVPMDTTTGKPQVQGTQPVQPEIPVVQPPVWVDTSDKLMSAVNAGIVLPWSKEYDALKATNPQLVAEYEAKRKEEQMLSDINLTGTVLNGGTVERTQRASDQILQFLTQNLQTDVATRFQNEVLNDPKLAQAYDWLEQVQRDLNEIDDSLDSLWDEIRASFTGEVPEARLQARIAKEAWPLIKQRGQVLDEMAIKQAEVTRLSQEAREIFDLKLQDAERIQNFAFQMYGVQRADEIRYEDIALREEEYAREIERSDFEYNRALQDWRALDAERFARERDALIEDRWYNESFAMDKALLELWVDPIWLSQEEKYQQLAGINRQQLEFEQYLKTSQWQIDIFNAQKGDWVVDADKGIKYNRDTWEYEYLQAWENGMYDLSTVMSAYSPAWQDLLSVPDGTVIPTRLTNVSAQNQQIRGKECAEYVNDIAGTKMGNTYESKLSICNEPSGVVGSVVAWQPQGSLQYGHTGIIVWEDGDNWLIKSSNYTPWTVTTDKIPKSAIGGYYTPDKIKELYKQWPETSPILDAFEVLAFDKPTLQKQEKESIQGLINAWKPEAAKTKLLNLATNNIQGADNKSDYQKTRTLVSALDWIEKLVNEYQAKWGDTWLLKGKYEDVKNKFGMVADPELKRLGVTLADQLDSLRRARSGAALTEFEEAFYDSLFPSKWKRYDLNIASIQGLRDSRQIQLDSYLINAFWDDIFQSVFAPQSEQTTQTGWLSQDDINEALGISSTPYKSTPNYFNQ